MSSPNSPNLVARLRASPWTSIFARVVSVAAALAVLAWIGRVATANANANASAGVVVTPDAAVSPPLPPPPPSPFPSPSPSSSAASSIARGRASPDDPVFVNQADEAELRRLPGVGAKRAEAIVALRRRVGRFNRVEDLMRVKGIGRAAIKKWRPLVRFDTPAASSDAGAP
jgi:competence protein ComEA